ncbi:MAG: ABC transporter permease [Candidatus Hodarchaeota archaeon]
MLLSLSPRIVGRESQHLINTIRGLAFIIALIIGVFGLINGLSLELFRLANLAGQSEYIFITAGNNTTWESSRLDLDIIQLLNDTNIKYILPQTVIPIILQINEGGVPRNLSTLLHVTNTTVLKSFWKNTWVSGGAVPSTENPSFGVLVGVSLFEKLEDFGNADTFVVYEENNSSNYLNATSTGVLNLNSHLRGALVTSFEVYEAFWSPLYYYSLIEIRLFDATVAEQTANSILEKLEKAGYSIRIDSEMKSQELIIETFREIVERFKLFALFLFVIVAIRIYNATVWLIIRFEREIHIIRALGATPMSIMSLFLFSSFIIGNIALILGILLGIFLPIMFIAILDVLLGVGFIFAAINWQDLLEVIIVANLAFVAGTIFPSLSIIRKRSLKPSE